MMQHTILPNGGLAITANLQDPDDLEAVSEAAFIEDLIYEFFTPNGDLEVLQPEDIGALTSSVILAKEPVRDEDGNLLSAPQVWWYPAYETTDPLEVLREKGEVVFTRA
jgi:hypothetical protein